MKERIVIKESLIQGPYSETKITKHHLIRATHQHQIDVQLGLNYLVKKLIEAGEIHDHTKLERIDDFYEDVSSDFKTNKWLKNHIKDERHHLLRHVPYDVDFIDVLEFIVDGLMAGMARTGYYIPRELPDEVLQRAFKNTVTKLLNIIEVDYE